MDILVEFDFVFFFSWISTRVFDAVPVGSSFIFPVTFSSISFLSFPWAVVFISGSGAVSGRSFPASAPGFLSVQNLKVQAARLIFPRSCFWISRPFKSDRLKMFVFVFLSC